MGCNGGNPLMAWVSTMRKPLELESEYPYTAKYSGSCHYDKSKGKVHATGMRPVLPTSNSLRAAVQRGPVAVGVYAAGDPYHYYKSGVVTYKDCPIMLNDHSQLVVGYGTDDTTGLKYFLIKNSWGADWGENGYIRIEADHDTCGIYQMMWQPTSN